MRRVYENVSRKRLACMKATAHRRVRDFAASNGYIIERWEAPDQDDAIWHGVLKGRFGQPRLEVSLHVKRNSRDQLVVEVLAMPPFIPPALAVRVVDEIYRSCA